jgi:hypothetical protein
MIQQVTPPRLFVSYSGKDASFVTDFANRFRSAGVPTYSFGDCNGVGAIWQDQVLAALTASEVVLCVMTPDSAQSRWVHAEIGAAWASNKAVVPILRHIDKDRIIEILRQRICGDVSLPDQESEVFNTILKTYFPDALPPDTKPLQGQTETFAAGTHIEAVPLGRWWSSADRRTIMGEGEYAYILSKKYYRPPFRIRAAMRFCDFKSQGGNMLVNAGILFGWSNPNNRRCYYQICMNEQSSFLELVGHAGADEFVDFQHLSDDQPFAIKQDVTYDFDVVVNERQVAAVIKGGGPDARLSFAAPVSNSSNSYPGFAGYVGVRPWRSRVEIEHFEITA